MWVLKNPLQPQKSGCHGDHTPTPTMYASQWHQCVHDPIPMTTKFTNGASFSATCLWVCLHTTCNTLRDCMEIRICVSMMCISELRMCAKCKWIELIIRDKHTYYHTYTHSQSNAPTKNFVQDPLVASLHLDHEVLKQI